MSRRLICLAAAAVISVLPLAAAAATLSFTTSATDFDSEPGPVLSLSRFDPTLGTLQGVTIEVNAEHETRFNAGSGCPPIEGFTCNFVLDVKTTVTATTLTGVLASANESGTDSCSTFTQFGCIGQPPKGFSVILDSLGNVAPGDLALFAGSSAFDISLSAVFEVTGAGDVRGFWRSAEATVTYTYVPVKDPSVIPLPAGGALLLSGLAALGVARRRRRAA